MIFEYFSCSGSASARGTPRHSSVGREQEAPPSARILSARSERSSHLGDGDVGRNIATPVKISRRELRKMSDDEVQVRRSNVAQTPASVQGMYLIDIEHCKPEVVF